MFHWANGKMLKGKLSKIYQTFTTAWYGGPGYFVNYATMGNPSTMFAFTQNVCFCETCMNNVCNC